MKLIYILTLTLLFSGCELLESQEDKNQKILKEKMAFEKRISESKEIQLEKLSHETKKELAILESKKELATIEKERELQKIRLESELEKQKITLAQEKESALFEQKMKQVEQADNMELKRYFMLILGLLAFISSFFILIST